jgi:hypothetical protein
MDAHPVGRLDEAIPMWCSQVRFDMQQRNTLHLAGFEAQA